MSEKTINSRIIHKHDTEAHWSLAENFTPKQGEIIVYDIDSTHNYERFKIGDGATNVNSLPFADDALRIALTDLINDVDVKVNTVSTLVGDTSVSEQIADAQMIYVGPDQPTDPNIQVWINTAEDGTGVIPVLPRVATITLAKANWTGASAPYSQIVEIATTTSATKVDLQPTAAQIVILQDEEIGLMAGNDNGMITVYAFGAKPSVDMTMQVLLQEVSYL